MSVCPYVCLYKLEMQTQMKLVPEDAHFLALPVVK